MTSAIPPYPYFNGIGFNPSYFSSTYITQDQANKLYLLKAYPDKAIAKETFQRESSQALLQQIMAI